MDDLNNGSIKMINMDRSKTKKKCFNIATFKA